MKKILCFIFLIFLILPQLFSNDFVSNPFFGNLKNDFAFYSDTRKGNQYIVGYQYIDENVYRIRHIDLKTKKDFILEIKLKISKENISINKTKEIKGNPNFDLYLAVQQEFLNFFNLYDRLNKSSFPAELSFTQTFDVNYHNIDPLVIAIVTP